MTYTIIPEPQKITIKENAAFTLTRLCNLEIMPSCEKAMESLTKFLSDVFSLDTLLGTGKETIKLAISDKIKSPEGYTLTVKDDFVEIIGSDEAGVFYGVQSLKQLLFQGDLTLNETYIEDSPRFNYRGFMLDCGRYFFTKEAIFVFLEMMALHKLNVFHWHLSDDQGFRAQILSKLLLTEVGSYRSHTNFNKRKHEGYYTLEDMREIVEYAHKLCIKVIPEIDSPGHSVAMIAAYPELSCFDRELVVATHWGIKHDVLCAGKESTYEFMKEVFDELIETFTDGVIHLGGDEVPLTRWSQCPHCLKRVKDEGLSDVSDLHAYYLNRLADYLSSKGVDTIMWNDSIKPYMVSSNVTRQSWNSDMSEKEIVSELNSGKKFIISNSSYYYFDLPYGKTSLEKTYDFEPLYDGIDSDNIGNVLGVEACLWTEFVPTMQKAGYCTFPRMGAFCESAWSRKENKDFKHFTKKLKSYYSLLKGYGIDLAPLHSTMPKAIAKAGSLLWWERRKLCWAGASNLIDNFYVKNKYPLKEEDNQC